MIHDRGERHLRWHQASLIVKILMVLAGVAVVAGFFVLAGFVVVWLWNWLMPVLFRLPTITFGEAWGLLILTTILFNRPHSVGQASRDRRRKRALRDRLKEAHEHDDEPPSDSPHGDC